MSPSKNPTSVGTDENKAKTPKENNSAPVGADCLYFSNRHDQAQVRICQQFQPSVTGNSWFNDPRSDCPPMSAEISLTSGFQHADGPLKHNANFRSTPCSEKSSNLVDYLIPS
jgi:hypothetical protein